MKNSVRRKLFFLSGFFYQISSFAVVSGRAFFPWEEHSAAIPSLGTSGIPPLMPSWENRSVGTESMGMGGIQTSENRGMRPGVTLASLDFDEIFGMGTGRRTNDVRRSFDEATPPHAPAIPASAHRVLSTPIPPLPELEEFHQRNKSILQRRLAQNYVSSGELHLKRDYEAAQAVLNEVKRRPHQKGQYKINYDFIAEDPFLHFHSTDIHHLYPNPINDQEWMELRTALINYPEVAALGQSLNNVFKHGDFDSYDSDQTKKTKQSIRKRMKRLYESAKEKETAGHPGLGAGSPVADLTLRLYGNLDRCIDGLQSGLSELEKEHFSEGEPQSAGDFISRVFTDYKMDFITKHGDLGPNASEFQTTAPQVLRQRMLYSLGLRASEAEIRYLNLGSPHLPELKPGRVMARFLAGEKTHIAGSDLLGSRPVTFEPFNLDHMIKLLHESEARGFSNRARPYTGKPGIKLTQKQITKIALADPVLDEAYRAAVDGEPNEYFAQESQGAFAGFIHFKDNAWLHLLEKNGYIKR
ncbi:MAG: hypothetical protein ABI041_12425 [Bdellovibrionia bacterium]